MDMDMFWGITLSIIVLNLWWKSRQPKDIDESRRNTVKNRFRKRGRITDEEIITVIIPTIKDK